MKPGEDIGESVGGVGSLTSTAPEVDHLASEQVKASKHSAMVFNDKVFKTFSHNYSSLICILHAMLCIGRKHSEAGTFSPPT